MKTRYIVLIAVLVVLGVTAIFVTGPIVRSIRYGTRFEIADRATQTQSYTIGKDDKFTIVVPDSASIGDLWTVQPLPAGLTAEGERHESSSDNTGASGKRYFTFRAASPGEAKLVLVDRFQGGRETYTVTINLTITG